MKASYITPAITLFHEDGSLDFDHQGILYIQACRLNAER